MCDSCGTHDHDHHSIYLPSSASILRTAQVTERDKWFEFAMTEGELGHLPGQFVEISIPGIGEAPISVSSSPTKRGSFEMVIRKVGRLTTAIHALGAGDVVGVRGPFGTHFAMDDYKGKDLLFVAGGIGLVPLRSAINYALDNRKDYGDITILFGCTDPSQRLFTDEIAQWKSRSDITFLESVDHSDSTWKGNVGVITTLIPKVKESIDAGATKALIVGPPVMYKFVIMELQNLGFSPDNIVVSLERRMKCGVGKCGHCQINNIYVCQDGPVFTYASITGLVEAL